MKKEILLETRRGQTLAELFRDESGFHLKDSEMVVHPELLDSFLMCSELGRRGVLINIESDLYNLNTKGRTFSGRTIPTGADSYFIGDETLREENKSGAGITMHYFPVNYCRTR